MIIDAVNIIGQGEMSTAISFFLCSHNVDYTTKSVSMMNWSHNVDYTTKSVPMMNWTIVWNSCGSVQLTILTYQYSPVIDLQ